MPQKLHRGRTNVFHKKNRAPLKIAAWILAAAVIVSGGYFGAKFLLEGRSKGPDTADSSAAGSSGSAAPVVSAPASDVSQPQEPAAAGTCRAFYLPLSILKDGAGLDAALTAAAAAGFNAVLFDMKDSDGKLLYASATPLAVEARTAADGALSLDAVGALFQTLKSKGFTPVPRLFAFRDPLAPARLSAAKISTAEHTGWTWYDGDPKNGGKAWLNPYADAARQYIIGLMTELKAAGADTVMLDGVEFPKRLSKANLTAEQQAAASKADALAAFVAKAREAMEGGTVLLASSGLAALGTDTALYGGNPVTFGASGAAPMLLPSTLGKTLTFGETVVKDPAGHPYDAVKAALSQIQTRLQVIDKETRPFLVPWLQGYGYSTAEMKEQIRAVTETAGQDASYILYNASGSYDFAGLG